MKFVFCGLGSIGQRHLINLLSLGEKDIIAYRTRNLPMKSFPTILVFTDLEKALKQKPDVAIIANPSSLHIPLAMKLAKYGCHLFIEKPLSTNKTGVAELTHVIAKKKLKVFMGFMMRYHPAVIQIKKWLESENIGKIICCQFTCGNYLPLWHPNEDYSKTYAARKELGGGPINTLCHEFDLMVYFFGMPSQVFCIESRNSNLKINTEHSAEILFKYKTGMMSEIHLDYIQNPPQRNWSIIGNKGKIEFDYYQNVLILYLTKSNGKDYNKREINYSQTFSRNDMFIAELKDFRHTLLLNKKPNITLNDGINNLKIILAAHKSHELKRMVNIKDIAF